MFINLRREGRRIMASLSESQFTIKKYILIAWHEYLFSGEGRGKYQVAVDLEDWGGNFMYSHLILNFFDGKP